MAELSFAEKQAIESTLIAQGYVKSGSGPAQTYSDREFQSFVWDSVGIDIDQQKYHTQGSSKGKRLRAFCAQEPNHVVGKLLTDLLNRVLEDGPMDKHEVACVKLAERLLAGAPVLATLPPESQQQTFQTLANEVRKSIEANQPQAGLDRLHTYLALYLRTVCEKNSLTVDRDEPVNSYLGKYIKALKAANRVESEMTAKILMYSIHVVEAFNKVRNEQSLAHPNDVLNYDEALLIFNNIVAMVNFIAAIEQKHWTPKKNRLPFDPTPIGGGTMPDDDIPF